MNTTFEPNPALTIEDFGDEIVMVNLQNGAYFTLKSSACLLWRASQSASGAPDLLERISAEHPLDLPTLHQIILLFDQWRADLLVHFPDHWLEEIAAFPPALPNGKAAMPPPQYEKFTNMQDILLLDPIHDVGELGWPHAKPNFNGE